MGEGGAVNPPAAIANAVTDALSAFDIRVNHLPITPEWIAMMVARAKGAQRSSCELSLGCPPGPDRGSWSCEASAILGRTG